MNYYELFQIPVSPVVDKKLVAQQYIALQKAHHPDFFTNESDTDKETALATSAAINKGYQIFQQTDKTIEYFLQLQQIIEADEKYPLPPHFLMEMMELNEAIDEQNDTYNKQIASFEQEMANELTSILNRYQQQPTDTSVLNDLKLYYYKKKYLKRILERLDE
ncbi:iron-sulfur cluster co-chaperone HscB C-terminal domain-containing protein [Ferruginibacter yonginensis]|uniref:Iron-sulfur cluster co-chaperone HscB C-terminal domain-containing protein n=1 Tax=Ferruginibacter yonginensis TaxID=1310416 RepID=A0ABV8QPZ3_9BACT